MATHYPLERVLIAIELTVDQLAALRSTFPEVTFETAADGALVELVAKADVLLSDFSKVDELITNGPKLRWVQVPSAGVERLQVESVRDRDLTITNGSGVMASNMAEHIIALMLGFARSLPSLYQAQRVQSWRTGFQRDRVFELSGQTAVLVGMGDIALETARRLKALGVTVIGVRRSESGVIPEFVDEVASIADLDNALGRADHVISSLPSTAETRGMFNAARLDAFKRGAYFYNVGRGASVIQPDLIAALESGDVAGAGLDVTDPETLPAGHPLWTLPNVVITAHTAGTTPHFQDRLFVLFTDNLRRFQAGECLRNVVDLERGY